MISENNRRIAKNTVLLYIRTFFTQLLALYTSRKVLEILGVEDYGIYNVVGGITVMLTFLNGSMSVATQRYLTIELGKDNLQGYNRVFNMACIIHLGMALLVFIAAETIGLWFLNTYLNIPEERMVAANWVYQASILTVIIYIIQTPYNASLTAHEKMNVYAYVGMGEGVLKLGIVFLLLLFNHYDKLVIYSILFFIVQLLSASIFRFYCIRYFRECRFHWYWDRYLFHSLVGFTSWNLFGTVAWLLKDQGINMVLNILGGPVINAARGISFQVSGAVQNLVNGFSTAVNPQLTKNYASNDDKRLYRLLVVSSKISFFLLLLVALPVIIETDFLLHLWLVEVPMYSVVFIRVILLEALFNTLSVPMITSLLATGNIKWYQITVGSLMLLNVPISYILLKNNASFVSPFIVSLIITLFTIGIRIWFCKHQLSLNVRLYMSDVIRPIFLVFICSFILPLLVSSCLDVCVIRFFLIVILSMMSVLFAVYVGGLTFSEKQIIKTILFNFLKKRNLNK